MILRKSPPSLLSASAKDVSDESPHGVTKTELWMCPVLCGLKEPGMGSEEENAPCRDSFLEEGTEWRLEG